MDGPGLALFRAAPLALVLPLPGFVPRAAFALALALAAPSGGGAWTDELIRGLALGLAAAGPVWAARWAGGLTGLVVDGGRARGPWPDLSGVLAWVVFGAAGGWSRLFAAYLDSYARWPLAGPATPASIERAGTDWLALAAGLALPTLLALAVVELCAGMIARVERAAALDAGAPRLARAARPIVALLLFCASLAAFAEGIDAHMLR